VVHPINYLVGTSLLTDWAILMRRNGLDHTNDFRHLAIQSGEVNTYYVQVGMKQGFSTMEALIQITEKRYCSLCTTIFSCSCVRELRHALNPARLISALTKQGLRDVLVKIISHT